MIDILQQIIEVETQIENSIGNRDFYYSIGDYNLGNMHELRRLDYMDKLIELGKKHAGQ